MIQTIGVMMAAYILTRSVEILARADPTMGTFDTLILKGLAIVTALVAVVGAFLLLFAGLPAQP